MDENDNLVNKRTVTAKETADETRAATLLYLLIGDKLSHADEDVPDLGGPDMEVVVEIEELEGRRYFLVGELRRPVRTADNVDAPCKRVDTALH